MGFKREKFPPSLNKIVATHGGNDLDEFTARVREILGESQLDIVVDITEVPGVFGAIFPALLKLHAVLAKRAKKLKLVGVTPGPFVQKLRDLGLEVEEKTAASGTPDMAVGIGSGAVQLPTVESMTARLRELKQELENLLKNKESLDSEISFFKKRITEISKGQGSDGVSKDTLDQIAELEKKNISSKAQVATLKSKVQALEEKIKALENEIKEAGGKIKTDLKTLEGEHKKKVDAIKSDIDKMQAEYDKRSKIRATEIQRLQSILQK